MTRPFECIVLPTPPLERPSWQAHDATATQVPVCGQPSWYFWRSHPAFAGHRATPPGRPADRVQRTPAAAACAADGATTRPSASPPSPATARSAGAVTSSVKPASERKRSIPARNIDSKKETEKMRRKVRKVEDC